MSTENVFEIPAVAPLTTPEARVLHDATCQDETDRLLSTEQVIKSAKTFTGVQVRKVLRANFAGLSPEEFVAHCRGES